MLRDVLAEEHVTSLPRPHRPAAPLATSHIATILKNRYYAGVVTFEGVEYQGRHQALVSEDLFEQCQRVREGRVRSREKPNLRTHYLKGSVFCGQCGEPLSIQTSRGRLGTYYDYFYCLGRQVKKNGCSFVATDQSRIEALVEDEWARIEHTQDALSQIHDIVRDHFDVVLPARDHERREAASRLAALKRDGDKLMQAYYADAISVEHLRDEQTRLVAARALCERRLAQIEIARDQLEASLDRCCQLLLRPQQQYLASDDQGRRELNQAVFRRIFIVDDEVVGVDLTPAFHHLMDPNLGDRLRREAAQAVTAHSRRANLHLVTNRTPDEGSNYVHESGVIAGDRPSVRRNAFCSLRRERPNGSLPWEQEKTLDAEAQGSNMTLLVGVTGFEPATSSSRTKRATKLRHTPWLP